jgi:hypothetical protein
MRTTLRITDRNRTAEDVPIFASKHSDDDAIYVVVKTEDGLVALDRRYNPRGFLVDPSRTLWEELDRHPAKLLADTNRYFLEANVTGDAVWLDLDS